jgi:hypothetical protein
VPRRKRTSPQGVGSGGDWLRRGQAARLRPWALEEELLAAIPDADRAKTLRALAAEFVEERARFSQIEEELYRQGLKVSGLDARLGALTRLAGSDPSPDADALAGERPTQRRTVDPHPSRVSLERDYWLCRCDGFRIDSPAGSVGIVEGLRFGSRVDRPDLLAVRAGLFGRRLLLIRVEEVDRIVSDEQRIVLRDAPRQPGDQIRKQLDRWLSRLREAPERGG